MSNDFYSGVSTDCPVCGQPVTDLRNDVTQQQTVTVPCGHAVWFGPPPLNWPQLEEQIETPSPEPPTIETESKPQAIEPTPARKRGRPRAGRFVDDAGEAVDE